MPLKNERQETVLVPIKVRLYEDENGTLQCGQAEWPTLSFILSFVVYPSLPSRKGMSEEIVALETKLNSLQGDDYWVCLYRIKSLAVQLAQLVAKDSKGSV